MNSILRDVLDGTKKKINRDIIEGLAKKSIYGAVEFIDSLIRNNVNNLNPNIGLVYEGYRPLTPEEEYRFDLNNNRYDIAKNYLYKVEFKFNLKGEEITRIMALPYVEENGSIIYLSDTPYVITPVLTEYSINPTGNEIFIRLLKDKITAKRIDRNYIKNGVVIRLSYIYAKSYKLKNSGVYDKIPLALYLFYKDGIMNTFKNRAGADIKILTKEEDASKYTDKYNVYESIGVKPKIIKTNNYRPHGIKILVPKEQDNIFVQNLIAGLLASFDLYPDYVTMAFFKRINTPNENKFWKILLGKIIFRDGFKIDKLIENMDVHLTLLDGYLDVTVKEKLKEINIFVEDFYDLLAYIIKNFLALTVNSEKRSGDINNRYIEILYYILFNIITGINKAFFKINENYSKGKISIKEINNVFNKEISTRKIYSIIKSSGVNLAIMPIDYTADNLYPKIAAFLEDQNRGAGVVRDKNNAFPRYTRQIRAEDAVVGSILYLPKKSPTPRVRINLFTDVDEQTGKFKLDSYKSFVDKVNVMLEGKIENNDLLDKLIDSDDAKVEGAD